MHGGVGNKDLSVIKVVPRVRLYKKIIEAIGNGEIRNFKYGHDEFERRFSLCVFLISFVLF